MDQQAALSTLMQSGIAQCQVVLSGDGSLLRHLTRLLLTCHAKGFLLAVRISFLPRRRWRSRSSRLRRCNI